MIREAFWYQIAAQIVEWMLEDFWPRIFVVVLLVPPLLLARRLLKPHKPKRTGTGIRAIGVALDRKIATLSTWGRWLGATALLGIVGLSLWVAWDVARLRVTADKLSWQADEFFRANCAGITTAAMTNTRVRNVEDWIPTYQQYSWRLQQVMVIIGVHELAQKGILEDRPLHTYSDEHELALLDTLPDNIIPTSFGRDLCAYLRNRPPRTP